MEQASSHEPLAAQEGPRFSSQVDIFVHSIRRREADPDGISAKAVIDGIVEAGVLVDDKSKYVNEVRYTQEKGQEDKTFILIKRADKNAFQEYIKALTT